MLDRHPLVVTIPASDLQRAKTFYRERLGLEPLVETAAWISYRAGDGFFQLYPSSNAGTAISQRALTAP